MDPDSSLSLFLLAGPLPWHVGEVVWYFLSRGMGSRWSFSGQAEGLGFSKEWVIIEVTTGQLGREETAKQACRSSLTLVSLTVFSSYSLLRSFFLMAVGPGPQL